MNTPSNNITRARHRCNVLSYVRPIEYCVSFNRWRFRVRFIVESWPSVTVNSTCLDPSPSLVPTRRAPVRRQYGCHHHALLDSYTLRGSYVRRHGARQKGRYDESPSCLTTPDPSATVVRWPSCDVPVSPPPAYP